MVIGCLLVYVALRTCVFVRGALGPQRDDSIAEHNQY